MSNYPAFEVKIDNDDGSFTPVPLQTVKVRDVTNSTNLTDVASDANGIVAAGTLSVDVGTLIRFTVEGRSDRRVGMSEVITT